jgi:hypothetical protein
MTTGQLAFLGVADETSLAAGVTGGTGDTTTVQGVTTGSVLHVDEDVQYGGYPYVRLNQAAGSACSWRAAITPGAAGQATVQFRVLTPATWASAAHMVGYLTQTTAAQGCRAYLAGSASPGAVRLYNNSGTQVVASANAVLANSTEYVFELSCTPNGAAGTARLKVWNSDASALLWDSGTQTSDFGTGALGFAGWGNASSTVTVPTFYAGFGRWADSITTWNGASLGHVNLPPTVSLTANQNAAAGDTVTALATASDADGSISSYAWSVDPALSTASPALSGATTPTVTLTAPATGNLVTLKQIVTDDNASTATAETEVRVPITSTTDVKPLALASVNVGAWTKNGVQANEGATLASAADTDYENTATLTSSAQSMTVRLQPRSAVSSGTVTVRMSTGADGTAHATVTLLEGTVVRQTWAPTSLPNSSTPTDYTFALSSAAIAAIVDWGNLYLNIAFTS